MTNIKTFEDACQKLGVENIVPDFSILPIPKEHQKSFEAYYKLIIISKALNEGWEPNWADTGQEKWYSYFNYNDGGCASGFGFSNSYCAFCHTSSAVGSRLCFKTRELAEYAGKQFVSIYRDYLILEDKELRKINAFLE